MAFVTEEEEQENQQGSMTLSGQGQAAPAQAGGGQAPSGAGSGQFTNVQDYVKANQPKTAELAQGISGGITEGAGKIRSQLEQKRADFYDPSKYGGAGEFQTQQIQQAGTTAPSQEQATRFQQLRTGAFAAPELSQQRASSADLQRRAQELQTATGRKEGLQRLVGKQSPTYSQGQRQLDQLLLAGDKPSRLQMLKDTRDAAGTLGSDVARFGTQTAADRTEAIRRGTEDLGTARTAQQDQISGLQQRLQESFAQGGDQALSQADLTNLGLEGGIEELYGIDPSQHLTGYSASQRDLSRMNALRALGGHGEVGNLTAFDPTSFQEQVAAQKALYDPQNTALGSRIGTFQTQLDQAKVEYDRYKNLPMEFDPVNNDQIAKLGAQLGSQNVPTGANLNPYKAMQDIRNKGLASRQVGIDQNQAGLLSNQDELARLRDKYKIGRGIGLEPEV